MNKYSLYIIIAVLIIIIIFLIYKSKTPLIQESEKIPVENKVYDFVKFEKMVKFISKDISSILRKPSSINITKVGDSKLVFDLNEDTDYILAHLIGTLPFGTLTPDISTPMIRGYTGNIAKSATYNFTGFVPISKSHLSEFFSKYGFNMVSTKEDLNKVEYTTPKMFIKEHDDYFEVLTAGVVRNQDFRMITTILTAVLGYLPGIKTSSISEEYGFNIYKM